MTRPARVHVSLFLALITWLAADDAIGQPLGTFRWQAGPYCNTLHLSVTQNGSVFALDGFDDLCGAATRASAVGIAFPNPDGSIGLGLTIVQVPGGAPVHLDVTISLATISGTWRDSAGQTGPFVFNPSLPAAGAPRPSTGGLSGVAVTAVTPGAGLVGGGSTGTVPLSVNFGGTGGASTVARSDHTHGLLGGNTGVGDGALASNTSVSNTALGFEALQGNTTGQGNTAVGRDALESNGTGSFNVAAGMAALQANFSGVGNTAVGFFALDDNVSGENNVAVGRSALGNNVDGVQNIAIGAFALDSITNNSDFNVAVGQEALAAVTTNANQHVAIGRAALGALTGTSGQNTAIGDAALESLTTGSSNVAVGAFAGSDLTSGSRNIYIGTSGELAVESGTIRIGHSAFNPTAAAYIGGIHGESVNGASDQAVLVDATGKLGTSASSARFKQDIATLADDGRLLRLRPVSFRYRPEQRRGDTLEYGLIAEEVADVMPELVIHDKDGKPLAVRYHVLAPLLLAEVQRLEHERTALAARIEALAREVAALRAGIVR